MDWRIASIVLLLLLLTTRVSCQCSQGPRGLIGPAGKDGINGTDGRDGESIVGPQGPQGEKGDTGDVGPMGPQGPQGERGYNGSTGPAGTDALPAVYESGELHDDTFINATTSKIRSVTADLRTEFTNPYGNMTGHIVIFDITTRFSIDFGSIIAVKGDQGERGYNGSTGAKGEKGDVRVVSPGSVGVLTDTTFVNVTDFRLLYVVFDYRSDGTIFSSTNTNSTNHIIVFDPDTSLIVDAGIANGVKGDKGDKGDTGDQGVQGIQGIQGTHQID